MNAYTFSEARQNFAQVLEDAQAGGEVRIKRKDGREFAIKPAAKNESPLNVEGIDLSVSASEIVDVVREIRER
ncbi:MAG: antitoxin (DNA-binding transcriptional repressor) of toxin-antitoxin stability system [Candidatus Latescibacterota bacterium]|jgi:antitoxin (DNA-binding transcriptional repressor) of toxin-antitoxin stability system